MKILILSHKPVFPTLDGGSLATKKIFMDLRSEFKSVDLICLKSNNLKNKNFNKNKNYQKLFEVNTNFNFIKLIKSLFNKQCYQTNRFYDKKISKGIIKLIKKKKYEYVLFEGAFPSVYLNDIKSNCNCKTIIRTHNVEHEIWTNLASNSNNIFKILIYTFLKKQMKKWEDYICSKCDFLFCISKNDQLYFNKKLNKETKLLPVSFELKQNKINQNFSIFHLGAMDWKPNVEGVNWFLKNVWFKKLQKDSKLKLYLAGKNMPKTIKNMSNNSLIVEGVIESAENYMKDKNIMIVPIFSGSGIRIKILEGMSMGIPILSTPKGAQGIDYIDNENILICKSELEFEKAIKSLQKNKTLFLKIGNGGKKLIKNHFSKELVIKNWKNLINEDCNINTESS